MLVCDRCKSIEGKLLNITENSKTVGHICKDCFENIKYHKLSRTEILLKRFRG